MAEDRTDQTNEESEVTQTALDLVPDSAKLNQESLELVNQIIAEHDLEKTKDLTYLFNQNQNKKTIVRVNKLNDLQDLLVDQTLERIKKRPDEISNTDLLTSLKTIQDMIDRGQKQVNGGNEQQPFIQINQQNNEVNVSPEKSLTKESRDRVTKFISQVLGGNADALKQFTGEQLSEADITEIKEDNSDGNN